MAASLVSSGALVVAGTVTGEQSAVAWPQAALNQTSEDASNSSSGAGSLPESASSRDEGTDAGPTTPEQARRDRAKAHCYAGVGTTSAPAADECRIGPVKNSERTIALIGDSHATMWLPALEKAAKELGWTVYFYGKPACSVIDVPVSISGSKAPYVACSQWRKAVVARVMSMKGLDAVIVACYAGYRFQAQQPDGRQSTSATFGAVWTHGAQRTFDQLEKATRRVIVLQDVPWPSGDVPSCLSQHGRKVHMCAFESSKRVTMDAPLIEAEKSAASHEERFVGLNDVICPQAQCQVVTPNGQIKYRDSHHLTAGYSTSLWRVFADRVVAAMD